MAGFCLDGARYECRTERMLRSMGMESRRFADELKSQSDLAKVWPPDSFPTDHSLQVKARKVKADQRATISCDRKT